MGGSGEFARQSQKPTGYKSNLGTSWGPDGLRHTPRTAALPDSIITMFLKQGTITKKTNDSCLKRHRRFCLPPTSQRPPGFETEVEAAAASRRNRTERAPCHWGFAFPQRSASSPYHKIVLAISYSHLHQRVTIVIQELGRMLGPLIAHLWKVWENTGRRPRTQIVHKNEERLFCRKSQHKQGRSPVAEHAGSS